MSSANKEIQNFNFIMEIMNVAVCKGLRKIFKLEWDKHYGVSKGLWDDSPLTGNEFYNMERTRAGAKTYLQLFKSGKRSEWDLTALFDAILYSNAIKMHLSPHVSKKVDELRNLRNFLIHSFGSQHKMSDIAFKNACNKVRNCFIVLTLSTADVERIRNSLKGNHVARLCETTYIHVLLGVFLVSLLSAVFYYIFNQEKVLLFKVLPTRSVHLIANRSRTVEAILEELHNLSTRNNRALTYLYISGNPGSGKSQLARLVGEQYGANTLFNGWFSSKTFVMTLNGRSSRDVLNSYADFARRMKCNDNNIANIFSSEQTTTVEKIESLQAEITKGLKTLKTKYTSLLIVDNVVKLSKVSSLLPQLEDEEWQGCQVLVTTTDTSSVPPNSSLTVHISVGQGMDPKESCDFLSKLSEHVDNENLVSKVAKELDYQPLSLLSAAFYVKQLRETKAREQFTWKDYLMKLDDLKHNLTEMKMDEVSPGYSFTMTGAVLLAVKAIADGDAVLKHVFSFLSYVSSEPLSLYLVESYVVGVDQGARAEDVRTRIRQCFLILSSEKSKVVSISLNRVVHDSIKLYMAHNVEKDEKSSLPLLVLQMLIKDKFPSFEFKKALIPHLEAFYIRTKYLPSEVLTPTSTDSKEEMYKRLLYLARVLEEYDESFLSRYFRGLGFNIFFTIG